MKKLNTLIFTALLLSLIGCKGVQLTNQDEVTIRRGYDFREYMAQGFLFSPDPYNGPHEVLGIITVELHPRIGYRQGRQHRGSGYTVKHITLPNGAIYTQMRSDLDYADVIREIHNVSTEWGGNAFVHFTPSTGIGTTDEHAASSYTYIKISGTVIKRE